jgi:integrating conjugative element protein (TIGR03757 family)
MPKSTQQPELSQGPEPKRYKTPPGPMLRGSLGRCILGLCLAAWLTGSQAGQAPNSETLLYTIEVFMDGDLTPPELPGFRVMVYDLSELAHLSEPVELTPDDPKTATPESLEALGRAYAASDAFKHRQGRIKIAAKVYEKLMRYGVTRIPAIVFDEGDSVVYGTTDIALALQDYYAALSPEYRQRFDKRQP